MVIGELMDRIRRWMVQHPFDFQGPTYDEKELFELVVQEAVDSYERGKEVGYRQAVADLTSVSDSRDKRIEWIKLPK